NEVDHLALDFGADGILLFDAVPWIRELLLQTEADTFLLAVDIKDHDVNVLSDFEDFRRMANSAPTHVGDVQQSVDAIQIDESAEIGDVLDLAFADVARGHFCQE